MKMKKSSHRYDINIDRYYDLGLDMNTNIVNVNSVSV